MKVQAKERQAGPPLDWSTGEADPERRLERFLRDRIGAVPVHSIECTYCTALKFAMMMRDLTRQGAAGE